MEILPPFFAPFAAFAGFVLGADLSGVWGEGFFAAEPAGFFAGADFSDALKTACFAPDAGFAAGFFFAEAFCPDAAGFFVAGFFAAPADFAAGLGADFLFVFFAACFFVICFATLLFCTAGRFRPRGGPAEPSSIWSICAPRLLRRGSSGSQSRPPKLSRRRL